jgi:hypothetical protein
MEILEVERYAHAKIMLLYPLLLYSNTPLLRRSSGSSASCDNNSS